MHMNADICTCSQCLFIYSFIHFPVIFFLLRNIHMIYATICVLAFFQHKAPVLLSMSTKYCALCCRAAVISYMIKLKSCTDAEFGFPGSVYIVSQYLFFLCLLQVLCFSPTYQKHSSRRLGDEKLHLGVNVCVQRPAMSWGSTQHAFLPHTYSYALYTIDPTFTQSFIDFGRAPES